MELRGRADPNVGDRFEDRSNVHCPLWRRGAQAGQMCTVRGSQTGGWHPSAGKAAVSLDARVGCSQTVSTTLMIAELLAVAAAAAAAAAAACRSLVLGEQGVAHGTHVDGS